MQPYHILVHTILQRDNTVTKTAAQIVYAFSLHGADINQTTEVGTCSIKLSNVLTVV